MKNSTITLFALFLIASFTANAQKQPQVQEISVRAPDNIKIDGKLNEWPNKFLNAYNSTDRIYYVMSNDDNNLYLTIRGMGNGVAKKAIAGGLTLTISHSVEKKARVKAADNVYITFPVPQDGKTTAGIMGVVNQVADFNDDTLANRKQIDSIVAIANKRINDAMKEIRVVGVKEVPDSVISIYNTQGIKAAAQFIKMQPIIELAIPLKYLGLSVDNPVKFSYNIKLSAIPESNQPGAPVVVDMAMPAPVVISASNSGMIAPPIPVMGMNPNNGYAFNSTDFWGEYTLVKK